MNPYEELQVLQELLDELLRGIQDTLQSGEILTDDFQLMLAETMTTLTDRIDQLHQEIATTPVTVPELTQAMPSSNVEGFAYEPNSQRLFVRFLGKYPDRNGPVYSYDDVPPVIFDLFQKGAIPARTNGKNKWGEWWEGKVPSIGASLYTLLKLGGYNYNRMT